MSNLMDLLKVLPQYIVPKHILSSAMHSFMQIETKWIKNTTIKSLQKFYGIDVSEAVDEDLTNYPTFNAFFTRALKPEVRPIDNTDNAWISPVDGCVSQSTHLINHMFIQAKGQPYTLEALLGGDISYAQKFANGDAAVIYLSPKDYHRVHMPETAQLISMTYIPGDLFAVNPSTVRLVEGLFARNERLVIRFANEHGACSLILVGAIFVGSMETVWEGQITPEYEPNIRHWNYESEEKILTKGEEIGRFNMGSTVILLSPENQLPELGKLPVNMSIKMGQLLAKR